MREPFQYEQAPGEKRPISVDFSNVVPAGGTVTSQSITARIVLGYRDATISDEAFDSVTNIHSCLVETPAAHHSYDIIFEAVMSNGEKHRIHNALRVRVPVPNDC